MLNIDVSFFEGQQIIIVDEFLTFVGFEYFQPFNDYKVVWVNRDLNCSIVGKVEFVEIGDNLVDVIRSIHIFEGIYSDTPTENSKITAKSLSDHLHNLTNESC